MEIMTPDEAISLVQSGDHVYIHEAAMAPVRLIELHDVEIIHLHTDKPALMEIRRHPAPDQDPGPLKPAAAGQAANQESLALASRCFDGQWTEP